MRKQLNCPNCGAPITSEQCQYCGTMFYDFSAIEIGKPCYLKLKYQNNIILVKAVTNDVAMHSYADTCEAIDCLGNVITSYVTKHNLDLDMKFHCVPLESNSMMEVRVL